MGFLNKALGALGVGAIAGAMGVPLSVAAPATLGALKTKEQNRLNAARVSAENKAKLRQRAFAAKQLGIKTAADADNYFNGLKQVEMAYKAGINNNDQARSNVALSMAERGITSIATSVDSPELYDQVNIGLANINEQKKFNTDKLEQIRKSNIESDALQAKKILSKTALKKFHGKDVWKGALEETFNVNMDFVGGYVGIDVPDIGLGSGYDEYLTTPKKKPGGSHTGNARVDAYKDGNKTGGDQNINNKVFNGNVNLRR